MANGQQTTAGHKMNDDLVKKGIHEFRRQIDACILTCDNLAHANFQGKGLREFSLVRIKLQEGKMWAGKILEEMGSELPPEFRDKANEAGIGPAPGKGLV